VKVLSAAVIVAFLAVGCAQPPAPPVTLTREQFATLYDDHDNVTDVWYMGSDEDYHHFCMEHWTATADGSNGHLDSQKFYQVPVDELGVKRPFHLTMNPDQWRLLRPHGDTKSFAAPN
jgi:hypothetical protein